ncbi:MAG: PH domain-containing protein [Pedobacter sp.]
MSLWFSLESGEQIWWQSCPAPRAYVFRRWKLSLACLPVWLGIGGWLAIDVYSRGAAFTGWFVLWAVFWLLLGYGTIGHLFASRLLWRGERYLLTDSRICIRSGFGGRHKQQIPLDDVEIHRVIPLSGSLATIQLRSRVTGAVSTMYCLEGASVLVGFFASGSRGKPVDSLVGS